MLAVAIVMAVWWATEALPLAVTSLTPIILLPALDIMPMAQTTGSYTHPVTFLLFGGFVLALAIERCGLHIRAAYGFLSLIRAQARYLVAVLMGVAAVTSMWISNTATTLMLLPVAISVTRMMRQHLTGLTAKQLNDFDVSVFLGLAFGATLGGMATMIGTAPNAFAVGFIQTTYNIEIGFLDWMMFAVPLMLVMLPLAWFVLTRITNPVSFAITPDKYGWLNELGLRRVRVVAKERSPLCVTTSERQRKVWERLRDCDVLLSWSQVESALLQR